MMMRRVCLTHLNHFRNLFRTRSFGVLRLMHHKNHESCVVRNIDPTKWINVTSIRPTQYFFQCINCIDCCAKIIMEKEMA